MVTDLTRPIVGIESRTAQEVFDIMCDRLKAEFGTEEAPRYTTRRLREEVRKAEERGQQYEREAALSTDAEPVAWMVKRSNFDGVLFGTELSFVRPTVSRTCKTEMVPLYDRPPQPAPSVAVKALDEITPYLLLYNLIMEAVIEGMAKATDPQWTAKDFTKSEYYNLILAALSAQVQDVAGWQDISTAPKDGTIILLFGGAYHGNPFAGYWELSQYEPERPWVSVVNNSKLYEHVPTHWMPLPAAPAAKLEEKP